MIKSFSCRAALTALQQRSYHGNNDDEHQRSSDEDDDEALQRARQWDEFKDGNVFLSVTIHFLCNLIEHRRGEGNRKNMG